MKNARRNWIKERLKYFRKQKNLQPKDVAEKINIKTKTYSAHEEGRSEPDLFRLKDICAIYSITVDEFLDGCPSQVTQSSC
jgi:transcriptional regulator with XRE-family HTH domain